MVGGRRKQQQANRGMNFTPEHLNQSISDSEGSCSTPKPCCTSINKVKNELQTVIELMGPSTPNFNQTSSNQADNEESVYSNTTSVTQEQSAVGTDPQLTECNNSTLPPDISLQEDPSRAMDSSLVVDKPSTMIDLPEYICPPPAVPTSFVFNSECMCPQIASYIQKNNERCEPAVEKHRSTRNRIQSFLRIFTDKRSDTLMKKSEYYTINIKKSHSREGIPEQLVFDLVDKIPESEACQCQCGILDEEMRNTMEISKNNHKTTKNMRNQYLSKKHGKQSQHHCCGKHEENEGDIFQDEIIPYVSTKNLQRLQQNNGNFKTLTENNGSTTRVDVYYFDHGNSSYFKTTDRPPIVTTETMAEKTEAYTTKFWAEIFGTFHIGFSFVTSFILQTVRFLLYSIIRPLSVGLIQLISDYFFKPLLATIFNGFIQPPLIFLYNIASSLRDLCDPVAEGIGYFIRECAVFIRAFRIVDVKSEKLCQSCNKNSDRKSRNI